MKIKTVIFDLDGTLLDTLEDLADASNQVLHIHGFPEHPVEKYNIFVGDGLKTLIARITPDKASEVDRATCCKTFMQVYAKRWDKKSKPYAGIVDMLKTLKESGRHCCVLSNKPHTFTLDCAQRFFIRDSFAHVLGQREGVPLKPDPAGCLEIAALTDAPIEQCIYVGDTSVDMQTGKRSGMFTIGVSWGFRTKEELLDNGADLIVDYPEEIVRYVVSAG
ncbi:HAD family hydrolase [Desulfopila sp. IMCC35008]|uniref:HAD family hydrolase n=1 Tax=Desulfopila sp. IMCC35008 TaxID=2653858 RepID=UPI0013D3CB1E|nr:HAD family hydrolase [Desulfopila sp. IMCC35008]